LLTMLKLFSEGPMLYTGCTYHEVVTSWFRRLITCRNQFFLGNHKHWKW
jgi:hypothetical protein